ncbi:hypothetical protein CFC35_24700 [Streptomyces sp. FBKL.4005]|uniref:hypothetical protein n=1 Tax=Streptomyces sp. FBKL.4005 TaxID=2015515 RepID=UPI000B973B9B|nr:hypothetical protein [Streptomyces sp. FBKL.4005]MCE0447031.1 hypothetical protein [Streptomyces tricolor]OYP17305.1 hypothetical protein CFC35_24700 [Streptomyces sp. FBKL.4005]
MSQKPQDYHLTELPADPSTVPGCSRCLSLSVNRENARSRRDYSAVSDATVELRKHQAQAHES